VFETEVRIEPGGYSLDLAIRHGFPAFFKGLQVRRSKGNDLVFPCLVTRVLETATLSSDDLRSSSISFQY